VLRNRGGKECKGKGKSAQRKREMKFIGKENPRKGKELKKSRLTGTEPRFRRGGQTVTERKR